MVFVTTPTRVSVSLFRAGGWRKGNAKLVTRPTRASEPMRTSCRRLASSTPAAASEGIPTVWIIMGVCGCGKR
jgi:hypothetical protein